MLHGKIYGFQLRFSQQNQSIESWLQFFEIVNLVQLLLNTMGAPRHSTWYQYILSSLLWNMVELVFGRIVFQAFYVLISHTLY